MEKKWISATVLGLLLFLYLLSSVKGAEEKESLSVDSSSDYRLRPGDVVSVSVFRQDDLDTHDRIDGKGNIRIPLLGRVELLGCTISEAEAYIRESFVNKEILVNPDVRVSIEEYASKYLSVFGEVKKPGVVEFPPQKNALDIVEVIALAGDFTGVAKKGSVVVTRSIPDGPQKQMKVDVMNMILGDASENGIFWVYPGDVVYVPASLF